MKVRKITHPYDSSEIHTDDIVLILGFFDGVHKGHKAVIEKGVQIANEKGLKSVVMTFDRHPALVYKKVDPLELAYLTTSSRKAELIENLGVDLMYELGFTSKLGALSPKEFVDQYIIQWNAQVVVAGFDYTYGEQDEANMEMLPKYAKGRFGVVTIEKQTISDEKISSTRVRENISSGNISKANELLGYYFETSGYVIHGDARGRELGYPTANVSQYPYEYLPKIGVYAVLFKVSGQWYKGMASIGYNVTFGKRNYYSIEVNIFDFNEEIYGENVRIKWIKVLRDEVNFDTIDELIKQLRQDKLDTKETLNNLNESKMK